MPTVDDHSPPAGSLGELLTQRGPVALFLDFDGVVADIAPTPDGVTVSAGMLSRLQSLNSALDGALAIVSGRDVASLDALLAPLSLAVAGDHGNVRRSGNGTTHVLNDAAVADARAIADELAARFEDDTAVIVERKPSAVAVHYRLAPEREDDCQEAVSAAVATHPQFEVGRGKMVVEARARGADKGEALRGFMRDDPFRGRTPVFIGDDLTDEDGFVAAQEAGGAGIKVGGGDTAAQFRLADIGDVPTMLDAIIRLQGWDHPWLA